MTLPKGRPKGARNRRAKRFEYRVSVLARNRNGEMSWRSYYYQTRGKAEGRMRRCVNLTLPPVLTARACSPWLPDSIAREQWGA